MDPELPHPSSVDPETRKLSSIAQGVVCVYIYIYAEVCMSVYVCIYIYINHYVLEHGFPRVVL